MNSTVPRFAREDCGYIWDRLTSSWCSDCPAHASWIRASIARARIEQIINGGRAAQSEGNP